MAKSRAIKSNKEKRTIVSNKKKERDQFKKEMDMILLKNKIGEMIKKISDEKRKIESYNDKYKKNIEIINEKYTDNSLYQKMFQYYMKNEYTLICISFINKIILDIKHNHLEQYQGKYNFNKIFISIAKELLLNQYELILLSLYMEYINLPLYFNIFSFEESLLYLCFYIKQMTLDNNEIYPIAYHLNKKYQNFEINYEKWIKIMDKKINDKLCFSYREINKRFREYNTPFNEYCGENYIDYNYIVDRILTMSLPYADIRKDSNTINNNNNGDNIKNNNKTNDDNKMDKTNNNNTLNLVSDKDKEFINQNILKPEFNFNNNNIGNKNNINEPLNNIKYNISNNNTKIYQNITPNNILHSLCNNNKFRQNQINKKTLVSNLNNLNINNINNEDIHTPNKINTSLNNNNLILNHIQNPSQSSLIFQQRPSLLDFNLFDKNNTSHIFDEEGEVLKRILKNSNDNGFMRSSQSFESLKYPYGTLLSNNHLGNINYKNMTYMNNNSNINIDNGKLQYKSNDVPFKPLNIICNKNFYRNIINNPNIIYNNNFGNNKPNNEASNSNTNEK